MEKKEFLTEKMTGFFGVRIYKEGTPMENRKIKAEDEAIEFNVVYTSAPAQFATFAKQYKNKDGEDRWRVTFKIGCNCRWFDGAAQPIAKPNNAVLDGKRYDVRIQGVELVPDDMSGKSARGYWVNAIQVSEHVDNPFTAFAYGVASVSGIQMTPDNLAADGMAEEPEGDLPF